MNALRAGRKFRPGTEAPEHRVATHDRLLQLFQAFREHNEPSFRRAAEAIISDELAANHHGQARELQQALGASRNGSNPANGFRAIPKDRRGSDDILFHPKPPSDPALIVLEAEAQRAISRVLDEHNHRLKLAAHGYQPKSKLLFWGPPGCGKTLAAHFVAQQLGLPLAVLRLSATVSSYLGETAARIQHAFDAATRSPMVLFFDEIEALAKDRDDENDVGELKRVVNTFLQAMDGFQNTKSLLVAASNHQYLLDTALWRRFDKVIQFPIPGAEVRESYLRRLLSGVHVTGSLGPAVRAAECLSFADIERAVTEAVKSMVLADRDDLKGSEIADEVKALKGAIANAKQRLPRSPRDSS